MKLRLPKDLMAAMAAAVVAAAPLAVTAGTGMLAAAAITAPVVQAETVYGWADGAPTVTDTGTEVTTTIVFGTSPTDTNMKLEAGGDSETPTLGSSTSAEAVWLAQGRYGLEWNNSTHINAIYAQGGQLFVTKGTVGAKVFVGSSRYTESGHDALSHAALRLNNNTAASDVTLVEDAKIAVYNSDAGTITNLDLRTHTLTKSDNGTLKIGRSCTGTGAINVKGGTLQFESGSTATLNSITVSRGAKVKHGDALNQPGAVLDINLVTVEDGGQWYIHNSGSDSHNTDFLLKSGGTISMHDSDNWRHVNRYGTLTIDSSGGSAAILHSQWKGTLRFGVLTGTGDISLTRFFGDSGSRFLLVFDEIKDYNGTITPTSMKQDDSIIIGTVDQSEGKTAKIDAGAASLTSTNFRKLGAGGLQLTSLASSGTLYMNYEGSLSIASGYGTGFSGLSVADNTDLVYTSATGSVIHLDQGMSIGTGLTINVGALSLSTLQSGIDLGIHTGYDSSTLTVKGLTNADYSIDADNGYWKLTVTDALVWDANWGTDALSRTPSSAGNQTYTSGMQYLAGTAAILSGTGGTGGENVVVFGGKDKAPMEGDTWIYAQSGTYKGIVGGNYADNWSGSSPAASLTGDTHIVVDGATVGTIIGGNWKDGKDASHTGSTYISIKSGDVQGAIVGAGLVTHDRSPRQTGNTNIFIYTSLTTTPNTLDQVDDPGSRAGNASDMVAGGFMWGWNNAQTLTLEGDTHITVDLTNALNQDTPFGKHIIGGNVSVAPSNVSEKGTQTLTGNTYVTINLARGSMAGDMKIIGGSWGNGNNATHTGDTNVTTDSGEIAGDIIGGSYVSGGTASISGTANVTVNGGSVGNLYGGNYSADGAQTTIGGAVVNLEGGTVKGDVYAAGNHAGASTSSTVGSTTVNLKSAVSFDGDNRVVSGGFAGDDGGRVTGDRKLTLTSEGGAYNLSNVTFKDFDTMDARDAASLSFKAVESFGSMQTAKGTFTSSDGGVMKLLTINSTGITGAHSGTAGSPDFKALGEMTRVNIEAVASIEIRNVTMQDVAVYSEAEGVVVTYTNAKAVATLEAASTYAMRSDNQTLTLTPVNSNTAVKGDLTVDMSRNLLASNFGKDLEWIILENVTIGSADDGVRGDFTLIFGDVLKALINDGRTAVLSISRDSAETEAIQITKANVDTVSLSTATAMSGWYGQQATVVLVMENIPEPATGALSVLALAALAARRRREKEN